MIEITIKSWNGKLGKKWNFNANSMYMARQSCESRGNYFELKKCLSFPLCDVGVDVDSVKERIYKLKTGLEFHLLPFVCVCL